MKRIPIVLSCWLLVLFSSLLAEDFRGPTTHEPGLLIADSIIPLSQSDFDSGTYRIQKPGYYYLTEDISFNPDPVAEETRTDKPRTAWFAAISVECDNVIIDLNTKTLDMSESFLNNHGFKVFSLIELNNSPFPQHLIFAFTGETAVKTAHNVVIKNGTLGRNSHHGIHGNDNTNVAIYDLVVKDWEVAGISLNGFKSGEIKNIAISGIEHEVPFTGLLALLLTTRIVLEDLVAAGDTGAQQYIDALDVVINDDNQNGKNHPTGTHDGNCYGLFLNRTLDVGPIVSHCDEKTANAITVENVSVDNIKASIIETVGIADLLGTQLTGNLFGVMRWVDAYPNGTFAPNSILKAQVYGVKQNNPTNLPEGFSDNILSDNPSEELFLSQVQPVFNGDFAGHTNKGAFGIRVDCGHGVTLKNCRVLGVENVGLQGLSLDSLSGGSHYSFDQTRYTGNDVYGMSLASCHNCWLDQCKSIECSSENGMVHGIAVMNGSSANKFINCTSSDHYGLLDNQHSVINPSSVVFGYLINNGSNANRFIDCVSQLLTSPRYCYGFYVHDVSDTIVESCLSSSHTVNASGPKNEEKLVAGFASLGSDCTLFRKCESREMRSSGEDDYKEKAKSKSVGFLLVDLEDGQTDKRALVTECIASGNDAGAGKAMGIFLNDVKGIAVLKNTITHNTASNKKGQGFGIYTTDEDDKFLILQNLSYGNDEENYRIKNREIPIIELSEHDIANYKDNPWYNISINY